MPLIERFAPDWLIISAGFDAHRNDPLAGLQLTSADFADMATRLKGLVPERRVLVVLEGGYDLEALTYGVGATLSALIGESYRPEPASTGEIGGPPSPPPNNSGSCEFGGQRQRAPPVLRRSRAVGLVRGGGRGVRRPLPDGPRVMLQKRSAIAHEGGTWSCAGGRARPR